MLTMLLLLSACATPTPVVIDCAQPPQLPEAVRLQAGRPQPSYLDSGKDLLDYFERQIRTAPR
jgi:hypothetical protein